MGGFGSVHFKKKLTLTMNLLAPLLFPMRVGITEIRRLASERSVFPGLDWGVEGKAHGGCKLLLEMG